MDEPTARLSGDQVGVLHDTVRSLAAAGTTVVYVSHFLEEVLELAETITVLRDGRVIGTGPADEHTKSSLIQQMMGRPMDQAFPDLRRILEDAEVVLQVQGLGRTGVFDGVDLQVRAGEIVALSGLVGSGRTEVVRVIAGADQPDSGHMTLDGADYRPGSPADALSAGVVMIPESRKDEGLVLDRPVRENISLPWLHHLRRFGLMRRREERHLARASADNVGVRSAGVEVPVRALSGGNQQKVLFARSLMRAPRVLIADEPTRGVDVGAKRAIYDVIVQRAADGLAVLIVSSELEEVLGLAHRILVIHDGRVVEEIDAAHATEQDLIAAAFGNPTTAAVSDS